MPIFNPPTFEEQLATVELTISEALNKELQDNTTTRGNATATDSTKQLLQEASVYYQNADYPKAIEVYQTCIDLDSFRDLALWYQTFAYLKSGKEAEAIQNLELIIEEQQPNYEQAEGLLKHLK